MPKKVARAIQHFAEHIESQIQISEVAEAVGLSTRSLGTRFQKSDGAKSPELLPKMRMNQARQLVLYTKRFHSRSCFYGWLRHPRFVYASLP